MLLYYHIEQLPSAISSLKKRRYGVSLTILTSPNKTGICVKEDDIESKTKIPA